MLFVPFIIVSSYCKIKSMRIECTMKIVYIWLKATIVLMLLTRITTIFIQNCMGYSIDADSSYYTVVAIIIAMFISGIFKIIIRRKC